MELIREPWDVYHAARQAHVTAHSLADFRRCPLEFIMKQRGELVEPDSPAFAVGRATHALILEGEAKLQAEYAVGAPINPKTGASYGRDTKAYKEWAEAQGKPAISPDDLEMMAAMKASVEDHDAACRLLSEGQAEGVLRGEWRGVACQSRFDWYNEEAGIVDLKTCEDLDRFERAARDFEYPEQLGFYYGLAWHLGLEPEGAAIIAVEKRKPHRVGVWRLAEGSLRALVERTEQALVAVAEAFKTNVWRTRYEEVRWM